MPTNRSLVIFALLAALTASLPASADSSRPGEGASGNQDFTFKLTPSYYATSNQTGATDLNLRAHFGNHAVWLGYYRRGDEFEQTRSGYEYTASLPYLKIIPSLQIASHGFVGGSLNAEIGENLPLGLYGLLGFGRTNRKDYYNLNFDPNDSAVYGLGSRFLPQHNLSLFTVRDNRLHTEQRITHLVWRYTPDSRQRWTVDLSDKHGRPAADEDSIAGTGLSVTYDFATYFVRLAREQHVNFSSDIMTRATLGMRF